MKVPYLHSLKIFKIAQSETAHYPKILKASPFVLLPVVTNSYKIMLTRMLPGLALSTSPQTPYPKAEVGAAELT